MNKDVMFSSKTDEWETPLQFFQQLDSMYHFTLDVCATRENAKCERYFTREENGLSQEWTGRCWMNPPYGRGIGDWMKKAYESVAGGDVNYAVVSFLLERIRRGGTITLCEEKSRSFEGGSNSEVAQIALRSLLLSSYLIQIASLQKLRMTESDNVAAEEVIEKIMEERNRLISLNKIEHPEYDHYINGWDDCISFLEDHIEFLSSCS